MPKLTLFVAIHGILTGRSNPTWPERFEEWAASALPDVTVLADHYKAGPFPIWNNFWKNPRLADGVVELVENYLDQAESPDDIDVHFVGHSNGCDVIRRAALRLLKRGYRVKSVLLFSAPLANTVKGLGFEPHLEDGTLGRLVAYAASDDQVLAPTLDWKNPLTVVQNLVRWPYGNLGRLGLQDGEEWLTRNGPDVSRRSVTRFFPGWGHGDFFPLSNPGRMAGMFETIARDSGVKKAEIHA